jgi:hypothetical protein
MGRACSTHGEKSNSYRDLVGKPEGKRPLGRPRRRWGNNIKMGRRETGYGNMNWIEMNQDRDQRPGSCEHDNEHSIRKVLRS